MTRQPRSKVVPSLPIVSALLAGAAIGAAGQFLLDSENGRRRRAIVRDKSMQLAQEGKVRGSRLAQDAATKARGLISKIRTAAAARASKARSASLSVASVTSIAPIAPLNPEELIWNVRQALNGVVTDPQGIDVLCSEGRIILRGSVFRDEVEPLLDSVQSVPGVNGVENQLTEIDNADEFSTTMDSSMDSPTDSSADYTSPSLAPSFEASDLSPESESRSESEDRSSGSIGLTSNLPPELSSDEDSDQQRMV